MKFSVQKQKEPRQILRSWLKNKGISISQCNRDCGYQSNYMMLITSPTNARKMTYEVIGRLLVTYGIEGPAIAIASAMRADVIAQGPNGRHI